MSRFGSSTCAAWREGPTRSTSGSRTCYLYLAPVDGAAAHSREVHAVQRAEGAEVVMLERAELARRFPWMRFDVGQIAGARGRGWFDGFGLLRVAATDARPRRRVRAGRGRRTGSRDRTDRWGSVAGVRTASSRLRNGRQRRGPVGAGRRDGRGRVAGRGRRRCVFVRERPRVLAGCRS